MEPHFFVGPDFRLCLSRYPHGNFDLVEFDGSVTRDFVGDNLKSGNVTVFIDGIGVFEGITEYADHFDAHGCKSILDVKPLDICCFFQPFRPDF